MVFIIEKILKSCTINQHRVKVGEWTKGYEENFFEKVSVNTKDSAYKTKSLEEINSTIYVPKDYNFSKNFFAFLGPGALVAVGYMDPGNWITSIAGGAQFGYLLLSVILISSLIAMLLQYMCAKLGIVTGMDLAQATRRYSGRKLGVLLWIVAELAIMATDIAEVIGGAIALHLLFNIPLTIGVSITIADVFLLLLLMRLGFRKIEAIVISLIMVVMAVFVYEVAIAEPNMLEVVKGFVPRVQAFKGEALVLQLCLITYTCTLLLCRAETMIAMTENNLQKL